MRPDLVVSRAFVVVRDPMFQGDFIFTTLRTALACVFGGLAATVFGLAIGLSRAVDNFMRPMLYAFQSIPLVVLGLVFLLVLGPSSEQAVLFVAFTVFLQMLPAIASAVVATEWNYIRIARSCGLNDWTTITDIILPRVAPAILDAFRSVVVVAWSFMAFAEAMGGEKGLGLRINEFRRFDHSTDMVVYVLAIAMCVVTVDVALGRVRRFAFPWLYKAA